MSEEQIKPPVENNTSISKEEFETKISSLSETIQSQNQQLNEAIAMLAQQQQQQQQKAPVEDEDDDDLLYNNPKEFKRRIAEQAKQEALAAQQEIAQAQQKEQQVVMSLSQEYPEITNPNSPLTIKALEVGKEYDHLPSDVAIKLAVRDAAAHLGILPKSKRQEYASDDFVAGGTRAPAPSADDKRKEDIPQEIATVAMLLGRNLEDDNVKARLKRAINRQDWHKYR